ncbi:MAG: TIGR01212 family radical SAM protein [Prolixibacteraceae bacterium]|jgi:radical SAM protein (TIGR01212 family)|nr:TIGR01212 family radical SAM protein [Prolixibacteraceae bacterium]
MFQDTKNFPWGHEKRYNDFSTHFKRLFKGRVQKVSIDAGFTCPNRDGLKGYGGCTYCNNKTFKPTYCNLEAGVTEQVEKGITFFSNRYNAVDFVAYFQAYTNTHAPLQDLILLYEEALSHPRIKGLVIATRPDCLPVEVLDYLEQKSHECYVMIELGVESCRDETLDRINRGHSFNDSVTAIENLAKRNIHSCAHMMLGLPGETHEMMLEQSELLSKLPVENLKLHQLQIQKGTVMANQYAKDPGMFNIFYSVEDYIDLIIAYLEKLKPDIFLERFVSQSPSDMVIAPKWGVKNYEFVAKLEKELAKRETWQGRLYTYST